MTHHSTEERINRAAFDIRLHRTLQACPYLQPFTSLAALVDKETEHAQAQFVKLVKRGLPGNRESHADVLSKSMEKHTANFDVDKLRDGLGEFKAGIDEKIRSDVHKLKGGIDELRQAAGRRGRKQSRVSTSLTLKAVSDIERLSQKKGVNPAEERFKVIPDYAYPSTRMNREELRKEMNKKSSYFHDLRLSDEERGIGRLSVEILQCFGIPKWEMLGETPYFCIAVCGNHAFKTDVMPPVANPMWLSKMRRACIFPIHEAYDRLYIGAFGQSGRTESKDGFAGRVVLDLSRLRPNCTYDVTLPLRQSAQVYSRERRGAIRFRFHLQWYSERQAMLSYLPKKVPKIEPNESVTIECCDTKSFQNVARLVYGTHMPGKFSMKQLKATVREINFTRIHILRYMRKREVRDTVQWRNPIISGFVFFAWMHCVYTDSVAYVPGHLITFLLLHLWKNYAYYSAGSPVQNGFLAPTWEEMLMALLFGAEGKNCIEPLEMEMRDESAAKSALQDMDESTRTICSEELQLKDVAEAFRSGVKVSVQRHRLKTYHNVFRGTEAVDFLVDSGYAPTRDEAVALGRVLAKELKLFEHIKRKHEFKDDSAWYCFLAYDTNEYIIKTHKPWGKPLFRFLGFMPKVELSEAEVHLEMPYSSGVDHPRFTVKDSLIIRSKKSKRFLQEEQENEESGSSTSLENSATQSEQLAQGLDEILEMNEKDDEEGNDDEEQSELFTIETLAKPPQQDIDVKKKADKKITDVLAKARHKIHGILLHVFNDRVYRIDAARTTAPPKMTPKPGSKKSLERKNSFPFSKSAMRQNSDLKGSSRIKINSKKDEYDRLLGTGKYSHGNPWISKLGVIVQPIVEIALAWLCLFRALFNIFTWRDPILSFWFSIIGPIVVIVLHMLPWRLVLGVVGVVLVGPQNWVFRVWKERKQGTDSYDPDKVIRKKKPERPSRPKEPSLFSMYTKDNRPLENDDLDASNVRQVVIPSSRLMYQRFYDWPPEKEYTRVIAGAPPENDPDYEEYMQSHCTESVRTGSSASERSGLRGTVARGLKLVRRRKRCTSEEVSKD